MKMKRFIFLIIWMIGLQSAEAQLTSFLSLIRKDSVPDVFITTDWKTLVRKKKDKAYLPADMVVNHRNGDTLRLGVKIRTRGKMRLNICSHPPIKLKFDKDELSKYSLSPLNEI